MPTPRADAVSQPITRVGTRATARKTNLRALITLAPPALPYSPRHAALSRATERPPPAARAGPCRSSAAHTCTASARGSFGPLHRLDHRRLPGLQLARRAVRSRLFGPGLRPECSRGNRTARSRRSSLLVVEGLRKYRASDTRGGILRDPQPAPPGTVRALVAELPSTLRAKSG